MSASLPDVKRVLVVDDQFEVLEMLRSMLALVSPRCTVLAVPSAEEGLLEMQRTPFDLVITDVRLPGMDGLEMTARVRRLRPHTPVFVITAYTDTAVALAAAERGATDFFRKPLDMERMVTAVQSVLGGLAEAAPAPAAPAPFAALRAILQALQTELGAQGVALATVEGALVAGLGAAPSADWPTLAAWLAPFARHALRLAQQMETPFQASFSAHVAPAGALCSLLVGESHQLLLFLPGAAQPALTPKAWQRLRQTAAALQSLLATPASPVAAEAAVAQWRKPRL
jgi:CheY-like chemotaxis protein